MSMAIKLGREKTYHEDSQDLPIKLTFNHVILQDHVTNYNHYNSTTRVGIAIKLYRMVTCFDSLLPRKSQVVLRDLVTN